MLDTNIFNWLREGRLDFSDLPQDGIFFATHMQKDEIEATRCEKTRAAILGVYGEVAPVDIPTECMIVGYSRLGLCKLADDSMFDEVRNSLNQRKKKPSNTADAMIAVTAIKNAMVLVTADRLLADVVSEFGGTVLRFPIPV